MCKDKLGSLSRNADEIKIETSIEMPRLVF